MKIVEKHRKTSENAELLEKHLKTLDKHENVSETTLCECLSLSVCEVRDTPVERSVRWEVSMLKKQVGERILGHEECRMDLRK